MHYRTRHLAQRVDTALLQEWQEEDDALLFMHARQTLIHVIHRCEQLDGDFWPSMPRQNLHPLHLAAPVLEKTAPGAGPLDEGVMPADGSAETLADTDSNGVFAAPFELMGFLAHATPSAAGYCASGGLGASQSDSCRNGEVVAQHQTNHAQHEAGTLHALPARSAPVPLQEQPNRSVAVCPNEGKDPKHDPEAEHTCQRMWRTDLAAVLKGWQSAGEAWRALSAAVGDVVEARCSRVSAWCNGAANSLRQKMESKLPWPQAVLLRRSALRFTVHWQGIKWPETRNARPSLDVVLDGL